MKYPSEYHKPEYGKIDEIYTPHFQFDSRGRLVMPLTPYQGMIVSTKPGSKAVGVGIQSEKDYPLNDPESIKSGYLHTSSVIRSGPKGGWVAQVAGGDATYPFAYYNEATGSYKFYVNKNGNVVMVGSITATTGYIGGWQIMAHTIIAESGVCGLDSEVTGGTVWRFWSGNATPGSANFRVDNAGNLYAVTATIVGTISGRVTSVIAGAIDASGHFIDANLTTATKQILGDFTFGVSGAIKMITDANNGLWLSPTGILGKTAGVTTFAIDIAGNATFKGSIVGNSITACTITGSTLQTGASGDYIKISSAVANKIEFYYDAGVAAVLEGTYSIANGYTSLGLTSGGCSCFAGGKSNLGSAGMVIDIDANNDGWAYIDWSGGTPSTLKLNLSRTIASVVGDLPINANLIPYGTKDIGLSGSKWRHIYLSGNVVIDGTVDGIDISTHAADVSAHHSSTSNGLAITPASVIMSAAGDVDNVKYLKFNSTYGQIYHGTTMILNFYADRLECAKAFKLLVTATPPANAVDGWVFFHDTYDEIWVFKGGAWKALAYVA